MENQQQRTGSADNEISGIVDSIVFQNEENGYTVCVIEDSQGMPVTAVGIMPYLNEGDRIHALGEWTTHKTYGRQFSVSSFDRTLPADEGDILRYLASGAIKGVGPKTAQKIVDKFGADSFDVIENNPDWLSSIPGISKAKAEAIGENFHNISGSREFMMFSKNFFTPATAMRIYKRWGSASSQRIRQNPYSLCGVFQGIGFRRADIIAASLGLDRSSDMRLEAGILHVLSSEASRNGHTCLPFELLCNCALSLLFDGDTSFSDKLSETVRRMCAKNKLIMYFDGSESFVYHPYIYKAERSVAENLVKLSRLCPRVGEGDIGLFIERSERDAGIVYAPMQRQAISDALRDGVLVLTGGPGTGKTTIIKGLINIFESLDLSVCLAAPTGRAAKRMSEATSHEAKTIHRLLEMEWGEENGTRFMRNKSNPLDEKVIIIDEASMIDTLLMDALLSACRGGSKLILIGDSDQIPSVGCGNVLSDIIASECFCVVRLRDVFRQSEESVIITNAHKINIGKMPEISSKGKDFFFIERQSDESTASTIVSLVCTRLPKAYGRRIVDKLQVITPSRKGAAGTESINLMLQAALNPPSPSKNERQCRNLIFRVGDRVMQMKNNYQTEWTTSSGDNGFGVFNGDVGVIESIDGENDTVTVCFDDRRCEYDYSMLDELEHAYAITVHKSQGSEYPVVIIPLYHCAPMLLSRNLLYTAVTRASKMVILVGSREVLASMVANDYHEERCTKLRQMILDAAAASHD